MKQPQPVSPAPGQESVWDYPRPPRVEAVTKHIQVYFNGVLIAETRAAKRVLETSHPPVYYIPPADVRLEYRRASEKQTFCEFKGAAQYYDIIVGEKRAENAAWFYPHPARDYEMIRDHIAFYPQMMDGCYVDGERVTPQPGNFYGGWITRDIVGPFKGEPGSRGW